MLLDHVRFHGVENLPQDLKAWVLRDQSQRNTLVFLHEYHRLEVSVRARALRDDIREVNSVKRYLALE